MRAVTTATAAAVLGMSRKSFDNLLSRLDGTELPTGRQGVERRVPVDLLPRLLLAVELAERLGIPHRRSFRVAQALAGRQQPAAPFVSMHADLERLQSEVDRLLETAIETVVRPPRGRPPGRTAAA